MSTTAMWLLLAVVVIVIVFASVLYKRTFTVHELALTGVMAALSLVAYLFFRVPFYGGSSFHLGNTFTALTALLLDGVSGGLAGAIGLALADILAGDPGYAVTTFILKFIIGITCGAVAHKVFKLRELDKHIGGSILGLKIYSSKVNGNSDPAVIRKNTEAQTETGKETETKKQTEKETKKQTEKETKKQTEKETKKQTEKATCSRAVPTIPSRN